VAEAYEIVKKSKNKKRQDVFQFKGEHGEAEAVGIEKFRLELLGHPELMGELVGLCQDKVVHGYRMIDDEQLAALAEDSFTRHEDEDDDYPHHGPPELEDGGLVGDEGLEADPAPAVGTMEMDV